MVFIKNDKTGEVLALDGWITIGQGESESCLLIGPNCTLDARLLFKKVQDLSKIEGQSFSFRLPIGHKSSTQQLLDFLKNKRIIQAEGYKRLKQMGHTVSDWRLNPEI